MFESLANQIVEVKDDKQREELVKGFTYILSFLHGDKFSETEFVEKCKPEEDEEEVK